MKSQDLRTGLLLKQLQKRQEKRSRKLTFQIVVFSIGILIVCSLGFVFSYVKADYKEPDKEHPVKETEIQIKTIENKSVVLKDAVPLQEEVLEAPSAPAEEETGFIYHAEIPMPIDHQEYLYNLCVERGLDYEKALAIIQHESVYDASIVSYTNDYGYFQINTVNHERLANTLKTPNQPLDPYVNMNWGTYMLSDLYKYWSDRGVTGEALDEYVWSSYNKGLAGFIKYGSATEYVKKVRVALKEVSLILDI